MIYFCVYKFICFQRLSNAQYETCFMLFFFKQILNGYNSFNLYFFTNFFFHYVSIILKKRDQPIKWLFSSCARFKQCYKESCLILRFAKIH